MKRRKSFLLVALVGCCLLVVASLVASPSAISRAAPQALSLGRWVIGGGGGYAEAGSQLLGYTMGQPVVGVAWAGPHQLGAGFWGGRSFAAVAYLVRRTYLPVIVRAH
ncbi:MAG: hypothetical protein PVI09_20445 [Anaerolineae bacterium]|jgi:hypothetical protein